MGEGERDVSLLPGSAYWTGLAELHCVEVDSLFRQNTCRYNPRETVRQIGNRSPVYADKYCHIVLDRVHNTCMETIQLSHSSEIC